MKTINWSVLYSKVFDGKKDSQKNKNSFRNIIVELGQKIVKKLDYLRKRPINFSSYSESKIWKRKGRDDDSYFRIYDSVRDSYIYFNSEEEVKAWLDQCYYL